MKNTLKIVFACLLGLFVSHGASHIQAQQYLKDSPETVKVLVENGQGEVRIVFKWVGEKQTTPVTMTCAITDAAGSFNTIPAKDMTFTWESAAPGQPCSLQTTPAPGTMLTGRLTVNTSAFNDLSVPYTGYLVFSSEPSGMAPNSVKFELQKTPVSSIPLNLENNTLPLPGTNFLPSFLNPLIPGALFLVLGVLYLLRDRLPGKPPTNRVLLILSVVLILFVGAVISLVGTPGPQHSGVYTDKLRLTVGRNDQTNFPEKFISILTSEKSGSGKIFLEKREGDYYLTFRDLPRAGEYNGKIAANVLSTAIVSVKVKVADWVLYFIATVLGGILAAQLVMPSITTHSQIERALVAAGSVLTLLVTHFTLYTDTWGSLLDYVKAFAAGAGINLVARPLAGLMYYTARRLLKRP